MLAFVFIRSHGTSPRGGEVYLLRLAVTKPDRARHAFSVGETPLGIIGPSPDAHLVHQLPAMGQPSHQQTEVPFVSNFLPRDEAALGPTAGRERYVSHPCRAL